MIPKNTRICLISFFIFCIMYFYLQLFLSSLRPHYRAAVTRPRFGGAAAHLVPPPPTARLMARGRDDFFLFKKNTFLFKFFDNLEKTKQKHNIKNNETDKINTFSFYYYYENKCDNNGFFNLTFFCCCFICNLISEYLFETCT